MESRLSTADTPTAVDLVVRLGAIMLSAGSPTDDVERSMQVAARALGLERVTSAVSFGSITLSYLSGPENSPATAMQMVRERSSDYRRLSAAARLVN
ncbi:MAG TPA: threonine/serine exporter family protein, partial [Candidatus Limnocylindria bacterium]